jgi:hypothetical protein
VFAVPDDHDDAMPIEPDHGSTTVWSDNDNENVVRLLSKHDGDIDKFLSELFGGSCSYETARRLAEIYAPRLHLTLKEFMSKYRRWKRGEPLSR